MASVSASAPPAAAAAADLSPKQSKEPWEREHNTTGGNTPVIQHIVRKIGAGDSAAADSAAPEVTVQITPVAKDTAAALLRTPGVPALCECVQGWSSLHRRSWKDQSVAQG
jgi:hypothetical protein